PADLTGKYKNRNTSMRSKSLLGVVWGIVTVLILLPSSYGQTLTNIFTWDTYWKYEQNGTNLPASWKTVTYDDSAWPIGAGLLGWPQDEALPGLPPPFIWTPLSLTNADNRFVTNFYFRTTFEFTNTTTNVVFVLTNLIDDGAVFYLNGGYLASVAMPATFTNTTFATRQDDISAHGYDIIHVGPTNLVQGTNVLAVESHQGANGSTDAILGMDLSWYRGTRTAITRQPATNVIIDCA